ncbi:MAG TPA: Gldg family protein [Desulfobacterales bacterium]|nr:Gldg family protein [Desulfobacterales bacterium]
MADKPKGVQKFLFSVGGLILLLLVLVLVNFLFARVNMRWDATEDRLYSLSDSTREILADLKHNVAVKVFYSQNIVNTPVQVKTYASRLLDFLAEYSYASDGRVSVEVHDPRPDSEEEEWAQKYAIRGIDLPTGETLYFGLVATAADQEETIPFLDPSREENLEYDITRIIARVQTAQKPRIAILSGLPVMGSAPMGFGMPQPGMAPWLFVSELRKTYEVETLPPTTDAIEEDVDLLLLIQPRGLDERLLFAIDQYVLRGGSVLIFTDPLTVTDPQPGAADAQPLAPLFTAWGIRTSAPQAVVDMDNPTRLRNENNQIEDNPFWLSIRQDGINPEEIITSKLESLLLPVAGSIEKTADSPLTYQALVNSSANATLADGFSARFGIGEVRRTFQASGDTYDLAVKLSGVFQTAFPDGRPPPANAAENTEDAGQADPVAAEPLRQGVKAATVIVVADADMLFDGYYVSRQNFLGFEMAQIFNDNLNFVLNAAEMLAGGQSLINIRSRGKFQRPFTRVQALEQKAQARWLDREQELLQKIDATNQKLQELEQRKDASQKLILSEEQEAEIQKFQEERLRINQELKVVRRNLRADIEALGATVKLINIFLMPLLVCIAGIGYAVYRRNRKRP